MRVRLHPVRLERQFAGRDFHPQGVRAFARRTQQRDGARNFAARSSDARITTGRTRRGTEVAATFYSLLETAKLDGANPAQYLARTVLAADRGEVLLPAEFAAVNVS